MAEVYCQVPDNRPEKTRWDCQPEQPRVRWVVRNGERVLQQRVGVVAVISGDDGEDKTQRQDDEWRDVETVALKPTTEEILTHQADTK